MVDHLRAAAAAADINTGGHLFSPWAALASQIRLTADSIDPTCPAPPSGSTPGPRPETAAVESSLRCAAEALEEAPPTPDALHWIWQVHQLRRLTAQLAGQPSAPG
ncbi:MAG: hypothetical protein ABJA74_13360 [Lapillicoccus sp.]